MDSDNFYVDMDSFRDFEGVTHDAYFEPVPDDWIVFATDVKGSTESIEEGRYRDVNKIGAASITVVREALEGLEFPFVFGGDGATLIVPPEHDHQAKQSLLRLKTLARDNFDLDLRVGAIPVGDIVRSNVDLEVAKLELTPGRFTTIFRGGGVTMAEDLLKKERSTYGIQGNSAESIDLTGLSCRWKPIPNERGHVLSVLIQARTTTPYETYDQVLDQLNSILAGGLTKANPVKRSIMSYKSLIECIKDEVRYHSTIWSASFFDRFMEILLAMAVFHFGYNPDFFDPNEYSHSLRSHSDYRKFDDMLRLTIDCNTNEREELESYLESMRESKKLFYGIQEAEESLMTCYVENMNEGGHLHFIDGGSGGYARAAEQLKSQVTEAANQ